ncbi:oligosaccharide flippase family protein [Litorisediminicola beolgyonensis]|uniref:Oligosaccharide flippase family protein n=1 Tax=Litorisediminicola beolgyonensis TaxID=1173614 RepID=A0ABW3ZLE9_9RHOB
MPIVFLQSFLSGPIARGASISFVIRILSIGVATLQAILTAQMLGPEGYGTVAYILSVSMIFATLSLMGTEPLAVREVARFCALKDIAKLRGFIFTIRLSLISVLALGSTILIIMSPLISMTEHEFGDLILFTIPIFALIALTLQNQGILRGLGSVVSAQVPFQILRPTIMVGILGFAWVTGHTVGKKDYLAATIMGTAVALIATFFALRVAMHFKETEKIIHPRICKVASQAAPFFAGSLLALLLSEINTLMLAWWAGPEETGLFQPIARITPLIILGVQAAGVRYAPRVSELWVKGEKERLTAVTRKFTFITTTFAVATAVFITASGEFILGLFGKPFSANSTALWWVSGAQIINSACGPVGMLLTMTGKASLTILPQVGALAVNCVLGWLFISGHGVVGAAIAMSGGIVVWNLGMLAIVRRKLGLDPSMLSLVLKRTRHT